MSLKLEGSSDIYAPAPTCILTKRQIEYLSLVALGFANTEIANILFVSKSTVKKTLEMIFDKLKAKDRANAVALAFIHEIISAKVLTSIANLYDIKFINPRL